MRANWEQLMMTEAADQDSSQKLFLDDAGPLTASKQANLVSAAISNWVSCDNCHQLRRVAQEPTADK